MPKQVELHKDYVVTTELPQPEGKSMCFYIKVVDKIPFGDLQKIVTKVHVIDD